MADPTQPHLEVEALRARIDAHRPLAPEVIDRIRAHLLPRFVCASNGLGQRDGLTLLETLAFLERDVVAGGHPLDRFLALERQKRAYELAEARAREAGPIDVAFVRALHRALTEGTRGREVHPGAWKEQDTPEARRRGRPFRFAPVAEVPALVERLTAEFTARLEGGDVLGAAAWAYHHLHLIHPFAESNGQVGRLLATTALLQHGYPPLVIPPDELGPFLDALAACDLTVPPSQHAPLAPGIDTSPLARFFCENLARTGKQLLDIVEGRAPQADGFAGRVVEDQARLLGAMLEQKELHWRVRGVFEVRRLFERLEGVARRLAARGPLYALEVESSEVPRTHAAWREFAPQIPAGDAGVVGQLAMSITGDPASGLKLPPPSRLRLVVAGSAANTRVLHQWDDQREPRAHDGPARSEEWPDATIERLLTRIVDQRRRGFEDALLDLNLSGGARAQIREQLKLQPGRETMLLHRGGGPSSGLFTLKDRTQRLEPPSGTMRRPAPPSGATRRVEPAPTAPAAGGAATARPEASPIEGVRPAEPPLSF